MIIVIEGCDGTGKTTLAQKLKHRIEYHEGQISTNKKVQIIHSGPPEGDPLHTYEMSLSDYTTAGDHLILDRWHWGETVYGPIYRGRSRLTSAGFYHVDKFLDSRGAVMLLVYQTPEVIEKRLDDRGEDFLKNEHISVVLNGFDEAFNLSIMTEKHKVIDATDTDVASAVILGYIRETYADDLAKFGTYVGPRYPDYLLLGEKRNDPTWPSAFVPGNATSGKYLLESLSRGVLRDSGLANACEEDLDQLYQTLNAPRVVTLGALAKKAADEARIPHANVPHPQYIRRFHNKKKREYGQVIARALYGEEVDGWLS